MSKQKQIQILYQKIKGKEDTIREQINKFEVRSRPAPSSLSSKIDPKKELTPVRYNQAVKEDIDEIKSYFTKVTNGKIEEVPYNYSEVISKNNYLLDSSEESKEEPKDLLKPTKVWNVTEYNLEELPIFTALAEGRRSIEQLINIYNLDMDGKGAEDKLSQKVVEYFYPKSESKEKTITFPELEEKISEAFIEEVGDNLIKLLGKYISSDGKEKIKDVCKNIASEYKDSFRNIVLLDRVGVKPQEKFDFLEDFYEQIKDVYINASKRLISNKIKQYDLTNLGCELINEYHNEPRNMCGILLSTDKDLALFKPLMKKYVSKEELEYLINTKNEIEELFNGREYFDKEIFKGLVIERFFKNKDELSEVEDSTQRKYLLDEIMTQALAGNMTKIIKKVKNIKDEVKIINDSINSYNKKEVENCINTLVIQAYAGLKKLDAQISEGIRDYIKNTVIARYKLNPLIIK